jgi:hypothetical protein
MKKNLRFPGSKKSHEFSIIELFYFNLLSVELPNNKNYFTKLPVHSQKALIRLSENRATQ